MRRPTRGEIILYFIYDHSRLHKIYPLRQYFCKSYFKVVSLREILVLFNQRPQIFYSALLFRKVVTGHITAGGYRNEAPKLQGVYPIFLQKRRFVIDLLLTDGHLQTGEFIQDFRRHQNICSKFMTSPASLDTESPSNVFYRQKTI